jgi:predicted Zn-dependent peptidase
MKKDSIPEIHTLKNGLRLVHVQNKGEVAHLGLTVLAGSRFEKPNEVGLAHFLEHCIFKGTKKRKSFHILSRLDAVGGELNAFTAKEEMCLYASFPKKYLNRSLDLMADIVANASFPERELEKEKDVIIDEINSYLDNPAEHIFDEFEAQIFQGHPLGNNILGTQELVKSFTKSDLQNYMKRHFFPENMVISIVGPYGVQKVLDAVARFFEHYSAQGFNNADLKFEHYNPTTQTLAYSNYQSHAILGGMAYDYHHPNRLALALLTNVLGGPALNSRLALSIREKHGLAYTIESSFTPFQDCGYHSIYFGTDEKQLNKAIDLVQKELKKVKDNQLGLIQLSMAKEQFKGHLALANENNANLMLGLGKSVLMRDTLETTKELFKKIDAIDAKKLRDVANEIYAAENTSILLFTPDKSEED